MTHAKDRKRRRENRKRWRERGGSGFKRMKGSRTPRAGGRRRASGGGSGGGGRGALQKAPAWMQALIGVVVIGLVLGTVGMIVFGIFA